MDASPILHPQVPDYFALAPELFGFPNLTPCSVDTGNDQTSPLDMKMISNYYSMVSFTCSSQVRDCMAVPSLSERDFGFPDFSGFDCDNRPVFEPTDQEITSGLMPPNIWSACDRASADHWGSQSQQLVANVEESRELKVIGRYSAAERKRRIMRYLKKRNQRNFNKTIKYECRKTLADKRVRVQGRFAKNNEENENVTRPTSDRHSEPNVPFLDDSILEPQIICNDDDWLQAAKACCLLNLPYFQLSELLNQLLLCPVLLINL